MSTSIATTPAMPSQPATPELMDVPPLHMFNDDDDDDDIRSDFADGDFSADSSSAGSWMQSIVVEISSDQRGLQPRDG
eukprot:CAMPEP_0174843278 /NCGR_PEP_ID=MMETSP1114-20130205/10414_1 /TAXON_ID=312471 /ORGANISM="Neobodo designis, Strain CCAP 1951/1" /LENGTH=77 /DNA_ID=CAMNT_0016077493 /DNA_START=117 /DNA_END=346 /DNA_ORIENTATION=+